MSKLSTVHKNSGGNKCLVEKKICPRFVKFEEIQIVSYTLKNECQSTEYNKVESVTYLNKNKCSARKGTSSEE